MHDPRNFCPIGKWVVSCGGRLGKIDVMQVDANGRGIGYSGHDMYGGGWSSGNMCIMMPLWEQPMLDAVYERNMATQSE